MGEENKQHKQRPNASCDGKANACHGKGRSSCCPCQHWNQGNQSDKFKEKTKEIELDAFNNTGSHNATQLNKSLNKIADHLQLIHSNNVSEAVCNMLPILIKIPPTPQGKKDPANSNNNTILPVTDIDLYLWKWEHAKAQDHKDKYNKNMPKAYINVYHQCSSTLKNDLKASNMVSTIRNTQDVIILLKLMQIFCFSYNAKTQGVMATMASHKRLLMHYQKNVVDNHTYHRKFLTHVETIKTYGSVGAVGVVQTFLASKMK
jgi:hypothetical protein